jgi:uncharacterized protein
MRPLSLLETRVLGVLIEKQHTVPDSYPLSLNSLTLGCNQKSARDPVIEATEAEVQLAIDELKQMSLVMEGPASRVTRYQHHLERRLKIPSQSAAILAILMLRGAQTSGELRINCERLHRFADISAVEAFLEELAAPNAEFGSALAVKLTRAPGAREARWAHLLSGEVDIGASQATLAATSPQTLVAASELAVLKLEVAALKAELAEVRLQLAALKTELGV